MRGTNSIMIFKRPHLIVYHNSFDLKRKIYLPEDLNPFTLRAAKTGLAILEIFYLQRHFLGNI